MSSFPTAAAAAADDTGHRPLLLNEEDNGDALSPPPPQPGIVSTSMVLALPSTSSPTTSLNRISSSLPTPSPLAFKAGKPVNSADSRFDVARCLSKRDDDVEGGYALRTAKSVSCESGCANNQSRITVH
jgi:hypothetical protein